MLSEPLQRMFAELRAGGSGERTLGPNESVINIHKLTERAGTLYEKLRYLVDYKEERQIRRSAIERIVKRKIVFEGGGMHLGLSLIEELIAGGYLANNAITEGDASKIDAIIARYHALENAWPKTFRESQPARRFVANLLAGEIESYFYPRHLDDAVARAFAESVRGSVRIERALPDQVFERQVLIACYRSLFNVDDESLRFVLWNSIYPEWNRRNGDEAYHASVAASSSEVIRDIDASLSHSLGMRLIPKLTNPSIYFSLVYEIVRTYGMEGDRILADQELLSQFARAFLEKQYRREYRKARESSVRAVLYIFITKILVAVALEVPYALYILGGLSYLPIAINIVIHPLILFATTLPMRPLGERNTKAIIKGVETVTLGESLPIIRIKARENEVLYSLFLVAYGVLFVGVFALVIFGLEMLHFDVVNSVLFLVFLALVSFFALRIRGNAHKWRIRGEDQRVTVMAFNVLILPIIRAGRWLSRTFSTINIFVFVLDFIIETPFKMLLKFSDAFVAFLREKQEDIY